jgi:cytochrome P450
LREVCLFLSAASQTTANGFVLFVLLLEDWLKSHPEDRRLIACDDSFLRKAVFEALRLAATVPARLRTATEDVTLTSGRTVRAGEHVALLIIPANTKQEKLFGADPESYNPHRSLGDVPPWGLTFGSGAHTCPGRPLVTGSRGMKVHSDVDGSLVSMARGFYAAGMELDPDHPPMLDPATHYNNYAKVMVKFSG